MSIEQLQTDGIRRIFAGHKSSFALRMAPMIDMIFLLLIFFLVAAKFQLPESFLPLRLATVYGQTPTIKPEPLTINIIGKTEGCQVQIGTNISIDIADSTINENLATLAERISDCLQSQKRLPTDPIEIVCADDVKWDHLARIYNLLFGMGLDDITFQLTE
jgi:biopolymer transport protein ExbD